MNIFRRIIGRGTEFALLLAATIIITVVMLNLYTAQGIKLNSDIGWVIGGFIGVFTIAHLTLCFLAPQADQFMLPVAALVNGLGLAMIHRIDLAEDTHLVSRQVMWMVVGIGLLITVLVFLRDHRSLQRYSYVLGAIGLFLLAIPCGGRSRAHIRMRKFGCRLAPFPSSRANFPRFYYCCFLPNYW